MATRKNLAFAYMGGLTGQDLIKLRLCNILTENRDVPTPQAPAVFLCRPERPWQDESERPDKSSTCCCIVMALKIAPNHAD